MVSAHKVGGMGRRTRNDSPTLSARQRARQAMSDELERARKRQDALASVFGDTATAGNR